MEEKKRDNIYLEKPSKAEGGKQPTCVEINLKIGWLFNSPSFKWHYTAYTWSFSCMTVCGYRMCGNLFKTFFLENNKIYTAWFGLMRIVCCHKNYGSRSQAFP